MTDREKKYLFDVITACDDIASYISGKTEQDYLENKLLRHGVERALAIVGEALKNIRLTNEDVTREIANVHRIIALRNRLIHAYDDISNEIIWSAASEEVPKLRAEVARLLDENR